LYPFGVGVGVISIGVAYISVKKKHHVPMYEISVLHHVWGLVEINVFRMLGHLVSISHIVLPHLLPMHLHITNI